jgi:hypothetical protein
MGASSHACSDQATTDARLFNPALPVPASASKKEPPLGTGWRLSKDREELKACRDHARANGAVEVGKVTVGIGAARATSSVLQSARIAHQPRCVSSPASRCGWCACGTFRRQKLRQLVRSRTIVRGGDKVFHRSGGDLRSRRSKIQPVVRRSFVLWTKGSRRDVCRGGLRGSSAVCFQ